jgi:hypothetical protein
VSFSQDQSRFRRGSYKKGLRKRRTNAARTVGNRARRVAHNRVPVDGTGRFCQRVTRTMMMTKYKLSARSIPPINHQPSTHQQHHNNLSINAYSRTCTPTAQLAAKHSIRVFYNERTHWRSCRRSSGKRPFVLDYEAGMRAERTSTTAVTFVVRDDQLPLWKRLNSSSCLWKVLQEVENPPLSGFGFFGES